MLFTYGIVTAVVNKLTAAIKHVSVSINWNKRLHEFFSECIADAREGVDTAPCRLKWTRETRVIFCRFNVDILYEMTAAQ